MKTVTSPLDLQNTTTSLREKLTIGFVPTMGGLHEGHLSLIEKAKAENDICIVSVFLNPTQFDNQEDLNNYPASFKKDIAVLKEQNVDILFSPSYEDLYPDNFSYKVMETELSNQLCGKDRPGHFEGVLTVVLKLLLLTQPNNVYFGEKDFQQLTLIKNMVKAFFIPTQVVACPTVRGSSGLALSSRNRRLSKEGLLKANHFAQLLKSKKAISELKNSMAAEEIKVDYLEEIDGRRFGAVKIENVRLIDNVDL